MHESFYIRPIDVSVSELLNIGFDKTYAGVGVNKHKFMSLKICSLTVAQTNILKQTALSVGTDCAVHREVITGKIDKSDCILSGSVSELIKISSKLKTQPFGLKYLGEQLFEYLHLELQPIKIREVSFDWKRPVIMGILNVTPDSFSDGGLHNTTDAAVRYFEQLVADGADIVDIGGESTRPGFESVNIDDEINRVLPVIKKIRTFDRQTVISIDTRNSKTARVALAAGADVVNDVSGLEWDNDMLSVVKENNCPVVITHSANIDGLDIIDSVYNYFKQKIDFLIKCGINRNNIILDPGICFGKTQEQNLEIVNRIKEFDTLALPLLIGHSRKSFMQQIVNSANNDMLDDATLLLSKRLIDSGVNILRVHNVKKHNLLKLL